MDGPNTLIKLKGWNELLDYLQTNNALRKSKFINFNFHDSTLLPPLSTMQQDLLDYLNKFIGLQSVRDEYYKELTKLILLPEFSGGYLKIHARGSGHCAILLVFIYNIVITIVSLYYKKSSSRNVNKMLAVLLCQELVIGLLIYNVYQNMSNNLNERNSLTFSVIFFSIDWIPEKTFSSFPSKASTLSS